jgi:hypothetical protein
MDTVERLPGADPSGPSPPFLREAKDADDSEQRRAAGTKASEVFLEKPTRWRDVVETTVYLSTVRALEAHSQH